MQILNLNSSTFLNLSLKQEVLKFHTHQPIDVNKVLYDFNKHSYMHDS